MLRNLLDTVGGAFADLRYNWAGRVKRFRIHIIAFAVFLTGLLQAVDPWALQSLFPERYQSVVWISFSILLWLCRKVQERPILVETTYYEESKPAGPDDKPL